MKTWMLETLDALRDATQSGFQLSSDPQNSNQTRHAWDMLSPLPWWES
jgi:hypothetical protein